MKLVLGVDFDNTIVNYDDLIYQIALERGLISPGVMRNKKEVRDTIRRLDQGDIQWQKIQSLVYGPRMQEAVPSQGVIQFFQLCYRQQVKVSIVSHKTEFATYDETNTNLRSAALSWLNNHISLGNASMGISGDDVYFESTRQDKISRIKSLSCTHFVDDLEETFSEASFPREVKRILYSNNSKLASSGSVDVAGNWEYISHYLIQ